MKNAKTIKDLMATKDNDIKSIISKTLSIENKYVNRRNERRAAVEEIFDMIKSEVK
jgi:hypothetical protein